MHSDLKDGKPIRLPGDRFVLEVTPTEVIITDVKAEKDDTGTYEVKMTNEQGTDEAKIYVTVRGPPTAPEGPLEVSKIRAESCDLQWKPPKVSCLLCIPHFLQAS